MYHTAILSYPGASLFETACASECFCLPRPELSAWYSGKLITFAKDEVVSKCGVHLTPTQVSHLDRFDMLVVPSWFTDGTRADKEVEQAILAFHRKGKRILSFCSGAFLLAQLGLFQDAKATTHWMYADAFQRQFPHLSYVPDVLYLFDGSIGCSAGSAAAIDLCLEVIRHDHGHDTANQIARRMVLSAHRKGSQRQFADTPLPKPQGDFSEALDWANQHLNTPISMAQLAEKANMSRRNFDRRFKANFNLTPKEWLTHQRLNKAKSLLESPKIQMEQIAQSTGFGNANALRHHFRKTLGITPTDYRQQFQQQARKETD